MPSIKLLQVCLANAMRDERVPEYRYGMRHARMCRMLAALSADVVSVKELRHCTDASGAAFSPAAIAGQLAAAAGLEVAAVDAVKLGLTPLIPTYNPFYLGLLYNPVTLVKLNTFCVRYDGVAFPKDASPHVGTALLLGHFAPRKPDGTADMEHAFLIECCHLPLREDHKLAAATWMATQLPAVRERLFPGVVDILRVGDFNTFADKPECAAQLALLRTGFDEVTTTLTAHGTGEPLYGTFFPFPHDIVPGITIAPPLLDSPACSVLDRVFVQGRHLSCTSRELILHNYDNAGTVNVFDGAHIPLTDHLPMLVTCDLVATT